MAKAQKLKAIEDYFFYFILKTDGHYYFFNF